MPVADIEIPFAIDPVSDQQQVAAPKIGLHVFDSGRDFDPHPGVHGPGQMQLKPYLLRGDIESFQIVRGTAGCAVLRSLQSRPIVTGHAPSFSSAK